MTVNTEACFLIVQIGVVPELFRSCAPRLSMIASAVRSPQLCAAGTSWFAFRSRVLRKTAVNRLTEAMNRLVHAWCVERRASGAKKGLVCRAQGSQAFFLVFLPGFSCLEVVLDRNMAVAR
jgi:hypothetical protein